MIDLHSHSYYSDGLLSPTALLELAAEHDVTTLALTDHDSTAGLAEALLAANRLGIQLINGVEISARWQTTDIHIVGLGLAVDNAELQAGLLSVRQQREKRNQAIAAKIAALGVSEPYQRARGFAGSDLIGRPHFARVLVEDKHCKDIADAFNRYLATGQKAFVAFDGADYRQAINWINGAGGKAILAHPARYKLTKRDLKRLLTDFKQAGVAGLEASYRNNASDRTRMLQLAEEFGLEVSVGSDYHGNRGYSEWLGVKLEFTRAYQPVWHDGFGGQFSVK